MKIIAMLVTGGLAGLMAAPSPAAADPVTSTDDKPACNDAAGTVSFRRDSAKVDKAARHTLDQVAGWLREEDDRKAEVEAYADPDRDSKNPVTLSDKRARAVETYLRGKGVDPDRVAAYGRGDTLPPALAAATDNSRVAVVNTCEPKPAVEAQAPTPAPTPTPETPTAEAPPPPAPVETPIPPAEAAPPPAPPPSYSDEGVHAHGEEPAPLTGIGMAVTAGGGVTGFFNSGSRASADPGFTWDARVTFGTRTIIGLDLGYLGAVQSLNIQGLTSNASLLSNGADADLRLQYPRGIVRPYLFGGIGWTHYSVQRSSVGTSGILGGDDVGNVPLGLGLAIGKPNGITFDLRATARIAFNDQLLSQVPEAQGSSSLSSWGVVARLGGEF